MKTPKVASSSADRGPQESSSGSAIQGEGPVGSENSVNTLPKRAVRSRASERASARRSASIRLTRTILLGTLAAGLAVMWMGEEYGVDREVILDFMLTSALFVGGLVVAGLAGAGLLFGLRHLYRSFSNKNKSQE